MQVSLYTQAPVCVCTHSLLPLFALESVLKAATVAQTFEVPGAREALLESVQYGITQRGFYQRAMTVWLS